MPDPCTHLDLVKNVNPRTPAGCEECHRSGHPIIRSYEPGEDWGWCCVDGLFMEPAPLAL